MDVKEILINLNKQNIIKLTDFVDGVIRYMQWAFLKFLATLCNGLENSVTKIYTLNGFFESAEVTKFIDGYKPLIWSILAISLAIIGLRIILNRKQNRDQLPTNILFSIFVIILLPFAMMTLNDITKIIVKDSASKYETSANEIIKNNLSDLYYLDKIDFETNGALNNIPSKNILNIRINDEIDISKISSKNKDILEKKLSVLDNGEFEVVDLEKHWFGFDENYNRFNIKSFPVVIISLLTTCITFVSVALKVARLEFELAFNKLFATIFAFADINDGKKIREIVKHIGSIFAVLITMSILIKLYVIFNAWISTSPSANSLDEITKLIVLIGVSLGVVDGPNIVEKIIGIDAGLKNGWHAMMGAYGAAQTAVGLAKGAKGAAKGLAKGYKKAEGLADKAATGVAGGIAGAAIGAASGFKNGNGKVSDEMAKKKNNGANGDKKTPSLSEQMKNQNKDQNTNSDSNSGGSSSKSNTSNDMGNKVNTPKESLQDQMSSGKDSNKENSNGLINSLNNGAESQSNGTGSNENSNPLDNNFGANGGDNGKDENSLSDKMQEGLNSSGQAEAASTLQDEMNNSNSNASSNDGTASKPNMQNELSRDTGSKAVDTPKIQTNNMDSNSNGASQNGGSSPNEADKVSMANNGNIDKSKTLDGDMKNISGTDTNSSGVSESDATQVRNNGEEAPSLDSEMKDKENTGDKNKEVKETKENRTIGEYYKEKLDNRLNNSKSLNTVEKAYNLGKNTGNRWAVKHKEKKKGDKN